MKQFSLFLLAALLLTSCAGATDSPDTPVTSPPEGQIPAASPDVTDLQPKSGDTDLTREIVFIHATDLLIRESFPPQVSLGIKGELPSPCHQLRVVINAPDSDNKIAADVYSVTDPKRACIQVIKPFEKYIDLGTFPTGHYTVWVNGEKVGEFDT